MSARPYVIVNVAASVDGKLDTFERQGAAISSERDRARVDALRASVDAVMVGGHTVVDEDPRLTVKSAALRAARLARGVAENPAKVAVTSSPELIKAEGRFVTAGPARVIVFTPTMASDTTGTTLRGERGEGSDTVGATGHQGQAGSVTKIQPGRSEALETLRQQGVEMFAMGDGRVDLAAALRTLRKLGVERVLVEGGGTLNFELLRLGLVDEVQLFIAPMIFGGSSAPTLADGRGLPRQAAINLVQTTAEVDDDGGVLLRYKVEPRE